MLLFWHLKYSWAVFLQDSFTEIFPAVSNKIDIMDHSPLWKANNLLRWSRHEHASACSHAPTTGLCPLPNKSSSHSHIIKIYFSILPPSTSLLSKWSVLLMHFKENRGQISHLLSVYWMSFYIIHFDFINIIICEYEFQLCSLSLRSLFQPHIMSSIFGLNIV